MSAERVSKDREYDYFEEHTSEYARNYWNKYVKGIPSADILHQAGADGSHQKAGSDTSGDVCSQEPAAGGEGSLIQQGRPDAPADREVREDDRSYQGEVGGADTLKRRNPEAD